MHLFSDISKILITLGTSNGQNHPETELIDLNGNCGAALPNYPIAAHGATGVYLNNTVIICASPPAGCYHLQRGSSSFEFLGNMTEKRYLAKSTVVGDKMWITGGQWGDKNKLKSTEYIDSSGITTPGPDLPEGMYLHAIININITTSILIGGIIGSYDNSDLTYFYNHDTKEWSTGPNLLSGTSSHATGTVIDHVTHQQHIVVVGGPSGYGGSDYVQILFHGDNAWTKGIWNTYLYSYNVKYLFDVHLGRK